MIKQTGTIDAVTKDGKRFKLRENGNWYSCFNATDQKGRVGDFVSFVYVENGSFNNVKGTVRVEAAPADTAPSGAGVLSPGATKMGGYGGKVFPVPALSPDRSIIRQNSLTHATRVVVDGAFIELNAEETASKVIEIARMFEAYSCGDLDSDIADEMVKLAMATETSR